MLEIKELQLIKRDYEEETVYTCKYCGMSFDEGATEEHRKYCIANYHEHKNCLTCNNYEIHKYKVGNEFEKHDYKTQLVAETVGSKYSKFYCNKKCEYLYNDDFKLEEDRSDCYITGKDDVVYKEMPCYKEQWNEIVDNLANDEDNFIDEEAKERYKEHKESR